MAQGPPGFLKTQSEHFRFTVTSESPWQFTTSPKRNYLSQNKYFPVLCMSSPITIKYAYPDKGSYYVQQNAVLACWLCCTRNIKLSMSSHTINNGILCPLESHTIVRTGKS